MTQITTKHESIKQHLRKHRKITTWDAINQYRATRLSAIIHILRHKEGWNIKSVSKKSHNGIVFCEYQITEAPTEGSES